MARFARFAMMFVAALTVGASVAQAQIMPPPAEHRYTIQFDVAATLGHKSASSFGAEFDDPLVEPWELFVEVGRMGNVTSGDIDARARTLADALQISVNPITTAIYLDGGLKYRLSPIGRWRPYAALGLGVASINTSTSLSGNTDVAVSLGTDLDGRVTKPLIVLGFGAQRPFGRRYLVDGSYRYGRMFARPGAIEDDRGANTQRLQIGIGMTF